ncbi:TetR/AcrR family transcriptional regulator [Chakrabartia godavariana]|nr:TetR/AcrR family transcriptional regulator [Chakrabartia godavariana]
MARNSGSSATMDSAIKTPRTERGRRTLQAILDAAAAEFGEKGFHDSSIVTITTRAGVALGSFYTYFDSKEAVFQALVRHMSSQVGIHAATAIAEKGGDALQRESVAFGAFLDFARSHKEIYRIIDESEFVDPQGYRAHYENTAARILSRLQEGAAKGEVRNDVSEVHAWALMGINVFLGLRFGVWSDSEAAADVVQAATDLVARGLSPQS